MRANTRLTPFTSLQWNRGVGDDLSDVVEEAEEVVRTPKASKKSPKRSLKKSVEKIQKVGSMLKKKTEGGKTAAPHQPSPTVSSPHAKGPTPSLSEAASELLAPFSATVSPIVGIAAAVGVGGSPSILLVPLRVLILASESAWPPAHPGASSPVPGPSRCIMACSGGTASPLASRWHWRLQSRT